MIVNETAIQQIVEEQIIKLLQVTIRPSTMDKNPYRKESCKRPLKQLLRSLFSYLWEFHHQLQVHQVHGKIM